MLNFLIGGILVAEAIGGAAALVGKAASMLLDFERDTLEYKPGEGVLTPSVKVKVDLNSKAPQDNPIGHTVAMAATAYEVLQRYVGKTYIMTVSEEQQGRVLAGVLGSVMMSGIRHQMARNMDVAAETFRLGQQAAQAMDVFLAQFPAGRTQ